MALPPIGRFARGGTTPTTTPNTNPSSGSTNSGTSGTASSTSSVPKATTPTSAPKTTPTTTTPTTPSTTAVRTASITGAGSKGAGSNTTVGATAARTTSTTGATSSGAGSNTTVGATAKAASSAGAASSGAGSNTTVSALPSFGRFSRDGSSSSRPQAGDIVTVNGKEYKYAGSSVKPVEADASTLATSSTNNQLIGGETSTSSSSYYDVDTALNSIYNQAKAAGINVAKPTSYGQSITDANRAQKLIDDYTTNANSIAAKSSGVSAPSTSSSKPVYDISSNIAEVQSAVKDYNLGITAPKTTQYSSQAEAQSALNSYIDTTQKALDTWSQNQPVQVYDDLGRQQTVTQSQWQQMQQAQQNQTWRENYTVLPEEVANSNANWRINSNGLYEWEPVTQSDKDHLAQENAQRARFGQAPKTTLTAGASPSEAYSKVWYSTGGNRTQVAGNEKLAKLKASSTINNSASAKSNTAQQQKATVWSAPKTQAVKIETAAKQQQAANDAKAAAEKAATVAEQARQEAVLKQQQVTAAQAKLKQTANVKEQTAIKQEIKSLQADANAAKKVENAANANATATKELAAATAAVVTASSSPFTANKTTELTKQLDSAKKVAEKTSAAAIKAGVTDHTGQIMLKDGTWIDQVEKRGKSSIGESSVKVFGTTKTYQDQMELAYTAKQSGSSYGKSNATLNPVYEAAYKNTIASQKAAQELSQKQRDAYEAKSILGSNREKLDPIWTGGKSAGTGESNVNIYVKNAAGTIISRSGTAAEYNHAEKDRAKYSAMDYVAVTKGMSDKQQQRAEATNAKINQAKWEVYDRTPKSALAAQGSLSLVDVNPLTGDSRINAKKGSYSDVLPFKTKTQLAVDQAVTDAKAQNPNISQAALTKVANDARRSQQSIWQNASEDARNTISVFSPTNVASSLMQYETYRKIDAAANKGLGWSLTKAGELSKQVSVDDSFGERFGNKLISLGEDDARRNINIAVDAAASREKQRLKNAAVGSTAFATEVVTTDITNVQKAIAKGDAYVSPYTKKILPEDLDDVLTPITESNINPLYVTSKAAGVVYGFAAPKVSEVISKSPWSQSEPVKTAQAAFGFTSGVSQSVKSGIHGFFEEEYKNLRERPATFTAEWGLVYAGGAAFGAGMKGAKLLGSGTFAKTADIAISRGNKGVWKGVNWLGTKGAKVTPLGIDVGVGGYMASSVAGELKSKYEEGGIAGATKATMKLGTELAIGVKPFKSGENLLLGSSKKVARADAWLSAGKYEPYSAADLPMPRTGWAEVPKTRVDGANILTDNYRYGVSLKLGNKPIASVAKGEGGKIEIYRGAAPIPKDVVMTKVTPVTPEVTAAQANVEAAEAALKKAERPTINDILNEGSSAASEALSAATHGKIGIEKDTISRIAGGGGNTTKIQKNVGITLTSEGKPIASISTSGKVAFGSHPAAPERVLSKEISAFDQQTSTKTVGEAEVLTETLREVSPTPELDIQLFSDIRSINAKIQSMPFKGEQPRKFELQSSEVPEQFRQPTLDFIQSYAKTHNNKIQLAGSAATKPQMGEYMARQPKDFEFYVEDVEVAAKGLSNYYERAGMRAGIDFKIFYKESKPIPNTDLMGDPSIAVEFPIKLKPGEKQEYWANGQPKKWKEGGSIFTHDFSTKDDIFAGYVERDSITIDRTPLLSLAEQLARKSDSSTTLTKNVDGDYEFGVRFDKALKHVADVVDMSTYAANEEGIPISKEIVSVVKAIDKKYANRKDTKYTDKQGATKETVWQETYKEKLLGDPIFKFILENERLPTPKEVKGPRTKDGNIIADKSVPKTWAPKAREPTAAEQEAIKVKLGLSQDATLTKGQLNSAKQERVQELRTELQKSTAELNKANTEAAKKAAYPTFQPFSKGQTPFFKKTVETIGGETEATYLDSAMNLAEMANNLSAPTYTPHTFEVTSTAVPKAVRGAITDSVVEYSGSGGTIQVKQRATVGGSVAMKAQSNPFTTRDTHDLELYVDDVPTYLKFVKDKLDNGGFKEGVDYKLTDHQVKFKGENGKWDTGIEVFDHKPIPGYIPSSSQGELAFGYNSKAPVEFIVDQKMVDGNLVTRTVQEKDLTELLIRKVAGSTMFKGGELQPAHPGRVKDVRDTVTDAAKISNSGSPELDKAKWDKNIVDFVNMSFKKFENHKEFGKEFKKVAEDPVVKFVHDNQRVPTADELFAMTGERPAVIQRTLFDSTAYKPISTGNPIIDAQLNKATSPFSSERVNPNKTSPFTHDQSIGGKSSTGEVGKTEPVGKTGTTEKESPFTSEQREKGSPFTDKQTSNTKKSKSENEQTTESPISKTTEKVGTTEKESPFIDRGEKHNTETIFESDRQRGVRDSIKSSRGGSRAGVKPRYGVLGLSSNSSKASITPKPSVFSPRGSSQSEYASRKPSSGSSGISHKPSTKSISSKKPMPSSQSVTPSPRSSPWSSISHATTSRTIVPSSISPSRVSPVSPSPYSPSQRSYGPSPRSYSSSPSISPSPSYKPSSSSSPSPSPSSYSPSPSPSSSSSRSPSPSSGSSGYSSSSSLIIIHEIKTAKKQDEKQRSSIRQRARARDKQLVSKTKVATFKEMFGQAKKPRASPFKSK